MSIEVTVLRPGILVRNDYGMILDARSTVTLIDTDTEYIIVDTGISDERNIILKALERRELTPSDIDILINTHLHADHCGNNDLFDHAVRIAHARELGVAPRKCGGGYGRSRVVPVEGNYTVAIGVKIFETPGHTWGSISVLVETSRSKYLIAGDALPIKDNYIKWVPPAINIGAEIAIKSMERIVRAADIVVPGHDAPFNISRGKPKFK